MACVTSLCLDDDLPATVKEIRRVALVTKFSSFRASA